VYTLLRSIPIFFNGTYIDEKYKVGIGIATFALLATLYFGTRIFTYIELT